MKKKIHLVLGSGGARGIAHIGVIEVLEETGHEIVSVTGCSMGAVVGGLYAAGFQDAYKQWMLTLTKGMLFSIMDFTINKQGFLKGERIFGILKQLTGHQNIDSLRIPFTAVATDMLQNEEVHYSSGDLFKALRASIAIPGIFTPVAEKGQLLVDGGVLNPLPLNLVQKKADESVVAVNLNGPSVYDNTCSNPDEQQEYLGFIWKWLKFNALNNKETEKEIATVPEYSLTQLLLSSYHLTQDRLTDLMVKAYPPNLLVEIPRNACTTFEFYKAKEMIEVGRKACQMSLSGKQSFD